jgi:hypothetical protein
VGSAVLRSNHSAGPEAAGHAPRRRAIHHPIAEGRRELPEWETAIEWLMLVGEHGGDPMVPRIAMMKALGRHEPKTASFPRNKKRQSLPDHTRTKMVSTPPYPRGTIRRVGVQADVASTRCAAAGLETAERCGGWWRSRSFDLSKSHGIERHVGHVNANSSHGFRHKRQALQRDPHSVTGRLGHWARRRIS